MNNLNFQSKRESSTQFSSGALSHFWKRSLLDLHWPVLFTQSLPPLWGLFQISFMVFWLFITEQTFIETIKRQANPNFRWKQD